MTQVILIDDEAEIRASMKESLALAGLSVQDFAHASKALQTLDQTFPGIVVSDVRMPDMDGLAFLRKAATVDADIPVVLITGHGHVRMAVRAIREGAYDFIEKPFRPETLITVVKRALEKRRLTLENRKLRDQLLHTTDLARVVIGSSASMVALREQIKRYANADVDVLIYGESGTGKELVARCLHDMSPRRNHNFVPINCAAIPGTLSGSEFFGHSQGAFTGAQSKRIGKFEYADKGVVFLDEIESMPLDQQAELLRVLQERRVVRLGDNREKDIDIRVFSAAKSDLDKEVEKGTFRSDLYFRLDVVNLRIPPLRDRIEDVPLLFQHFLHQHGIEHGEEPPSISPAVYDRLLAHNWPGNVRELQNNARRYALGFDAGVGKPDEQAGHDTNSLGARVAVYERRLIQNAIQQFGGNVSSAAKHLGISRRTLYNKLGRKQTDGDKH
ncbi:MAG TPA: DNA-binding response regulator [Gammaproteobacteria bacterium]|nr:DNA-binding response regulator [Gammaproteobacteria bacterium]